VGKHEVVANQHFMLTLRVAPGRDGVRNLRALLKIARRLGLRAIDARESFDKHQTRRRRSARLVSKHKQRRKGEVMDMRQFKKPRFLKVDDIRDRPRQVRIAGVELGQYGKPDLFFENGDKLGLSATNNEILTEVYGWESENWLGHLIDLYVGKGKYDGEDVDMIVIKPISKREGGETTAEPVRKKPTAKAGVDFDDQVNDL